LIREVVIRNEVAAYSYYWLRPDGSIIVGWDDAQPRSHAEARKLLRGIGRGEHLKEKLLASRAEDTGIAGKTEQTFL